jgi:Flp pilus assembly protein TadB
VATKKQQRRKYRRAQGRGRLYEDYEPKQTEERPARRKDSRPRGVREPARPTWMRSLRRAAMFAVGLFLFVTVVPIGGTKTATAAAAIQAASFFVFLVPFGYLMDAFIYNRWLKRQG